MMDTCDSPPPAPVPTGLLTVADVAEVFSVSTRTVRRWIEAGRLPAVKVGHRTVRVHADAVVAFATSNEVRP